VLAGALASLHRRDGGRILASLIRKLGSFDLAEEALQDAYAKALQRWPVDGMPANPPAWISVVAWRCGLDRLKHERRAHPDGAALLASLPGPAEVPDEAATEGIGDERLRLIFTCCHPALAPVAQVTLALRSLCGLSTREIARALLEPEATTAQRLVRAKAKIAAAAIPYQVPAADLLAERLAAVLAVIYCVFNEGYVASAGAQLLRPDLCAEALRLGCLLTALMPDEAEAQGLLALMLLHESRREARVDAEGQLVPLEEQVRARWNPELIAEGTGTLALALTRKSPGPYQIQAAIAALHAAAPCAEATDWLQIAALYGALLRHVPTPIVELNAAVALAMSGSIDAGLAWIARIEAGGTLDTYHLLHAARADLSRRAGQLGAARASYERALELADNAAERRYLQRRLEEVRTAGAARPAR
jgi:RNA polymerase sigma-70 factor (ECF subfamily)